MSSMPARNDTSPKKPWSTATSKQRPSAAKSRLSLAFTRRRRYAASLSLVATWRLRHDRFGGGDVAAGLRGGRRRERQGRGGGMLRRLVLAMSLVATAGLAV